MNTRITYDKLQLLIIESHCKEFSKAYSDVLYSHIMNGSNDKYMEVDNDLLNKAIQSYQDNLEEERRLRETARLNNIGMAAEKEGRTDDAIKAYEENIKIGYEADHAYVRLRIIYKRNKDWENMARVIRRYSEVYGMGDEWTKEQIIRFMPKKK